MERELVKRDGLTKIITATILIFKFLGLIVTAISGGIVGGAMSFMTLAAIAGDSVGTNTHVNIALGVGLVVGFLIGSFCVGREFWSSFQMFGDFKKILRLKRQNY